MKLGAFRMGGYMSRGLSESKSADVRFKEKTVYEPIRGCIIWVGAITAQGYGSVGINSKIYSAHAIAYEKHKGAIPKGYNIDHLCRTERCVNPYHLEAVPTGINIARQPKRTHCKQGHEFTKDNTIHRKDGYRGCRKCVDIYHGRHLV